MKTLQWAAAALAVGALALPARAETTTTNAWWDVTFEPGSFKAGFPGLTVGELGTLTNDESQAQVTQPYAAGVWKMIDGDESYVTNQYNPTNVTAGSFGGDYCIKLDTQGNDLTWALGTNGVNNVKEKIKYLVDADLYLVGSDSAPDGTDFDAASDVQAAVYLKNLTDENTGETTNSVLCVYVDDTAGHTYWQELKGVSWTRTTNGVDVVQDGLEDNSWVHVQVLVNHSGADPEVSVFVNGTRMSARDGNAQSWLAANNKASGTTGKVNSVAFRGTGAVDNFAGKTLETSYEQAYFKAEVYLNGVITNELCQVTAEKLDIGGADPARFDGFFFDDFLVNNSVSYTLTRIEIENFQTGSTSTYRYEYDLDDELNPLKVLTPSEDIVIGTLGQGDEQYQTGEFSVKAFTGGATLGADPDEPITIVRIYFETLPEDGDFKLTATQNVGTAPAEQKFNVNTLSEDETTFTFAQTLTQGGTSYVLSTIQVGETPAGIEAAPEGLNVVVTVPLSDQIAEGTYNVATATYVEGSLADGEALQGSRDGNVYTYTKYTPPVAIIIAGTVTNKYDSLRGAITNATAGDTIYLLRDDAVSFTAETPELMIDKAITIDGGSNTLYGVSNHACATIADRLNLAISGSGDVTIKNLKMAEFSDTAVVQYYTYPIWVRGAYAGTLTLDGVTITDFSRTAVNISGGAVVITNCVFTGDTTRLDANGHAFQGGVEVGNGLAASVTIADTEITGMGSVGYPADSDSDMAAAVQMSGLGTITIKSGAFAGQYSLIVSATATGGIVVDGGDFDGDVCVENGAGTLAIHGGSVNGDVEVASALAAFIDGGWFKAAPAAAYIAAGYEAKFDETNAPRQATQYKVVPEEVRYDITFNDADGTFIATTNVVAGATDYAPADPVPVLVGIKFAGWTNALDATDATVYTAATMPAAAGNATYAAKYDPLALEPIAVTIGGDADDPLPAGTDPITIDATAGFTLRFAAKQTGVTYILQSAATVNGTFADVTIGEAVVSFTPTAVDQVVELTDPDTTSTVKFFRVRVVLAE